MVRFMPQPRNGSSLSSDNRAVSSEPNRLTTARLRLPDVLIIDDEHGLCKLVSMTFAALGLVPESCHLGPWPRRAEAMSKAQFTAPLGERARTRRAWCA
jgi:hypothetical protein